MLYYFLPNRLRLRCLTHSRAAPDFFLAGTRRETDRPTDRRTEKRAPFSPCSHVKPYEKSASHHPGADPSIGHATLAFRRPALEETESVYCTIPDT